MNLFHSFANMNILSWIYFSVGHPAIGSQLHENKEESFKPTENKVSELFRLF